MVCVITYHEILKDRDSVLRAMLKERSYLESIASEFGDAKSYQDARRLSDEIDEELTK